MRYKRCCVNCELMIIKHKWKMIERQNKQERLARKLGIHWSEVKL